MEWFWEAIDPWQQWNKTPSYIRFQFSFEISFLTLHNGPLSQSISSFLNEPSMPKRSAWVLGLPGRFASSVLYWPRESNQDLSFTTSSCAIFFDDCQLQCEVMISFQSKSFLWLWTIVSKICKAKLFFCKTDNKVQRIGTNIGFIEQGYYLIWLIWPSNRQLALLWCH